MPRWKSERCANPQTVELGRQVCEPISSTRGATPGLEPGVDEPGLRPSVATTMIVNQPTTSMGTLVSALGASVSD